MTASTDVGGMLPELPPRPEFSLVIPTNEHFLQLREQAKQEGKIHHLHDAVSAWEAVAKKCKLARAQLFDLAVMRLEVERDLGAQLTQTVAPGRPKKRSRDGTISESHGLPDGVTKQQAERYRQLASLPREVFLAYIDDARQKGRSPSSAGARSFADPVASSPQAAPRSRRKSGDGVWVIPEPVLDMVTRIMTPDVVVGRAKLEAKKRVAADAADALEQLKGDVFVAQCPDPTRWLPAIEHARRTTRIYQAVVVLPAEVWTDWFASMQVNDWLCCFLTGARRSDGTGVILAHLGGKQGAFKVAACHGKGMSKFSTLADHHGRSPGSCLPNPSSK